MADRAAQPILAQVQAVAGEVREQAMTGIPEAEREGLLDLLMTMRLNLVAQAAASIDADAPPGDGTIIGRPGH